MRRILCLGIGTVLACFGYCADHLLVKDFKVDAATYGFAIEGLSPSSRASGTKCEFAVKPFFQIGQNTGNISIQHAGLFDMEIKLGDMVLKGIPERLDLYNIANTRWRFRFSSLKWMDGATVNLQVKGRFKFIYWDPEIVSVPPVPQVFNEIETFNLPFTVVNKVGTSLTTKKDDGTVDAKFTAASNHAFSSGYQTKFPMHTRLQSSFSAASTQTAAQVRSNIVAASVYIYLLHGYPTDFSSPTGEEVIHVAPAGTPSVASSIASKGQDDPPLTFVAATSCATLAPTTNAAVGWGLTTENTAYLGFTKPVFLSVFTPQEYNTYEAAWQLALNSDPDTYATKNMGHVAETISLHASVYGSRAWGVANNTNSALKVVWIDLAPRNGRMVDKAVVTNLVLALDDPLKDRFASVKFVYLDVWQYSVLALTTGVNIWWIEL